MSKKLGWKNSKGKRPLGGTRHRILDWKFREKGCEVVE
jgi:hypothetical protein